MDHLDTGLRYLGRVGSVGEARAAFRDLGHEIEHERLFPHLGLGVVRLHSTDGRTIGLAQLNGLNYRAGSRQR